MGTSHGSSPPKGGGPSQGSALVVPAGCSADPRDRPGPALVRLLISHVMNQSTTPMPSGLRRSGTGSRSGQPTVPRGRHTAMRREAATARRGEEHLAVGVPLAAQDHAGHVDYGEDAQEQDAVVPERFATILLFGSDVTYQIRPSARTVENRIPAHGCGAPEAPYRAAWAGRAAGPCHRSGGLPSAC